MTDDGLVCTRPFCDGPCDADLHEIPATLQAQIAGALGTDDGAARAAYRAWADGKHDLLAWTEGRLGMTDTKYVEAMQRASRGAGPESEA